MSKLQSIAQRLRHFPDVVKGIKIQAAKYHLEEIKLMIVLGLQKNNLVTPPLKQTTINLKTKDNKPHIYTALVGWGQYDQNSMINGLKIVNLSGKMYLQPQGTHYSKKSQQMIWAIHEYGAIITNGFGKKILIKIPPRFPMRKGLQRYLNSSKKKEINEDIKDYIASYLSDNKKEMNRIKAEFAKK